MIDNLKKNENLYGHILCYNHTRKAMVGDVTKMIVRMCKALVISLT